MIPPGNGSQTLHKLGPSSTCALAVTVLSVCCATMEIFADKQLFETHFGFSCEEVVPDSDDSDLEVDLSEDDSDGGNGISLQMNIN